MDRPSDKLLQRSQHIEEYSLGADLVRNSSDPDYVWYGVQRLRRHALNLCRSQNLDEQEKLENINSWFQRNDKSVAEYDLHNILDKPLTNDIVGWVGTGSDYDIEEFCRWSLYRTNGLTDSLYRDGRQFIDHTLNKTELLVRSGLFPRLAFPVVEAATRRYHLRGIDTFHSGGDQRVAFCGPSIIGVSNLYGDRSSMTRPTAEMRSVMFHEYLHGAGSDRGFFWGISTPLPALRIMEEAYVEHANVVAHAGPFFRRPLVIHPQRRPQYFQSPGTYEHERTFLAEVCDHAKIAVEDLGMAYFSPRGDGVGERVRAAIEYKIGRLFGNRESFFEFVYAYNNGEHVGHQKLIAETIGKLATRSVQSDDYLPC